MDISVKSKVFHMEAEKAKALYKTGCINRQEAEEHIIPYIEMFNERSKEIARKYNMKPRLISFSTFVR